MVVELRLQYCRNSSKDPFESFPVPRCIITFEYKVDVQNREFLWLLFQNRFFLINYRIYSLANLKDVKHISKKTFVSKSMLESIISFSSY